MVDLTQPLQGWHYLDRGNSDCKQTGGCEDAQTPKGCSHAATGSKALPKGIADAGNGEMRRHLRMTRKDRSRERHRS